MGKRINRKAIIGALVAMTMSLGIMIGLNNKKDTTSADICTQQLWVAAFSGDSGFTEGWSGGERMAWDFIGAGISVGVGALCPPVGALTSF